MGRLVRDGYISSIKFRLILKLKTPPYKPRIPCLGRVGHIRKNTEEKTPLAMVVASGDVWGEMLCTQDLQRSICARMRITTHHIQCSWAALSGSQPTLDFHVNDQVGNAFSARWRSYQGRRRILCLWGVNSRRRMPSYVP